MFMKIKAEAINKKMDDLFDILLKDNISLRTYSSMDADDLKGMHCALALYEEYKELLVDMAKEFDEQAKFREDMNIKIDRLIEKSRKES